MMSARSSACLPNTVTEYHVVPVSSQAFVCLLNRRCDSAALKLNLGLPSCENCKPRTLPTFALKLTCANYLYSLICAAQFRQTLILGFSCLFFDRTAAAIMIVPNSRMIVTQMISVIMTPVDISCPLRFVVPVVLLLPVWRRIRVVVLAVGLLAAIGRVVRLGLR